MKLPRGCTALLLLSLLLLSPAAAARGRRRSRRAGKKSSKSKGKTSVEMTDVDDQMKKKNWEAESDDDFLERLTGKKARPQEARVIAEGMGGRGTANGDEGGAPPPPPVRTLSADELETKERSAVHAAGTAAWQLGAKWKKGSEAVRARINEEIGKFDLQIVAVPKKAKGGI